MKYLSRLVISLALVLAGVVIASPASATPLPSTGVQLLWLSDDDPSTAGHQAALNISVSGALDTYGTFYVYEGTSVPLSGSPLAELEVRGSARSVLFTTTANVGAASRFSVKFESINASYSNTNFENIRLTCGVGTYSSSGFGPCLNAPAGHYVAYQGSTEFLSCPPGRYQPDEGQMLCLNAPAGTYVPNSGATSAALCPLGTFSSNTGSLYCEVAPLGFFVSLLGSTAPIPCPSGYTTSGLRSSICHQSQDALESTPRGVLLSSTDATLVMNFASSPAVAGTIRVYQTPHIEGAPPAAGIATVTAGSTRIEIPLSLSLARSTDFISIEFQSSNSNHNTTYWENIGLYCGAGSFSGTGFAPCNSTPAGTFTSGEGSTQATSCLPGTYQPQTGQTACVDAPAGTYVADSAASSPTQCPDGHFNVTTRAASRDACIAAPAGSYVNTSDRTRKQSCGKGSFQPGLGQTSCIPAVLGFFVNTEGAASQTKCRRGTTTDVTGSTSCKLSPKVPKLPASLSRTRINTVYLNSGKNADGLRVTLSSGTKTCRVQKDSSGYKVAGLKTGKCLVTLNIKGNSRYASITVTRNIRVL
jgi:hypothetical protein